jgi:23S rRNA (uridine2552-2'-O)-methyltransferase
VAGRGPGSRKSDAGPGRRGPRQKVKTARGRKISSTRWLQRQLNDPFVQDAKAAGYRSRAAYKLAEIDDRFGILGRGRRVVDLGAAPGSWSQLAVERVGAGAGGGGVVFAVDCEAVAAVPGARHLTLDLLDANAPAKLEAAVDGPVDAVLSDMAAPATGHRQTDHLRTLALCEAAFDAAEALLAPGGAFVAKALKGGGENAFLVRVKQRFAKVRFVKPQASRKESREVYLVATGFRPGTPTQA